MRGFSRPSNDIVEQAQCRTQISVKSRNRLIDRTDSYMFAERLHMLEHGAVICLEGFMDTARFQRTEFMVCSSYSSSVYRCLYAEVIVDCKLPPRSGLVRQCLGHIESLINGSGVGMRSLIRPGAVHRAASSLILSHRCVLPVRALPLPTAARIQAPAPPHPRRTSGCP